LYDTKELAAYLGLSTSHLWKLVRDGAIPAIGIGWRTVRFDLDEVLEALRKRPLNKDRKGKTEANATQ
jgi:excisionase family DNA binding protein